MTQNRDAVWLTVEEVASRLQVSQETVRRWIRAGNLAVLDLGGPKAGYRILDSALDAFVAERYGPVAKIAA